MHLWCLNNLSFTSHLEQWGDEISLTALMWVATHTPLEKAMAPHSSTLAWKIPWMEEAGGLQSIGSQSQTLLKRLSTIAEQLKLTQ